MVIWQEKHRKFKLPLSFSPLIPNAEHSATWYGILVIGANCPDFVPSQLLVPLTPSLAGQCEKMKPPWLCAALLSNS